MYEWADHANCIPCIKGKKAYWGLIYMFARHAWDKAINEERYFGNRIFTDGDFLEKELPNCLRLATRRLNKKKGQRLQGELFDLPCECT
jgi:hypothetical protein